MKYIAILDSDDELSEDTINELKEIVFVGDEKNPYCFDITSIKEEPKALEQEEIVRCKDCKHRPVKTDTQIVPPNGMRDETCPCINADDWWYSYMPEDDFFCADGEK